VKYIPQKLEGYKYISNEPIIFDEKKPLYCSKDCNNLMHLTCYDTISLCRMFSMELIKTSIWKKPKRYQECLDVKGCGR
jgi:hypothetical protein